MTDASGARDVACFQCRASIDLDGYVAREGGGFHHQYGCSKGLPMPDKRDDMTDEQIVSRCPGGEPRLGFQIGGYYSHMWFEPDGSCLTWNICSDGDFPTNAPDIRFHICNFEQIERFVSFWGAELRQRGIIPEKA